jgi:hypothetical protein
MMLDVLLASLVVLSVALTGLLFAIGAVVAKNRA